ncbi:MAG: YkvA family protein [Anaerolineales bacterium]
MLEKWKQVARKLKSDTYALYLAYKHPGTPWYAKVFAGLVIAYAFSPIDLVPDFIPVLGYLDDLILVPLGVTLAMKMIPSEVMEECRAQAEIEVQQDKPTNWVAAAVIIAIWVTLAALAIVWIRGLLD